MNLTKKIVSAAAVTALCLGLLYTGGRDKKAEKESIFDQTATLRLWYTDEALTDYLGKMAVKYNEEYGIRVIPVLQSGLELLENINKASLTEEATPDLFIATNDIIEKAYLTGLAMPIHNADGAVGETNFPESALNAVTYHNEIMGYPFYYETSALLYNKTYLEQMAREMVKEELTDQGMVEETEEEESSEEKDDDKENKEEKPEGVTVKSEEQLREEEEMIRSLAAEKIPELIPATFDELLTFADSYNAPENVEAVFKWDVSDIFYNFFFAGNYLNLGGPSGDEAGMIDLYSREAIRALKVYQDMNEYFAIDAESVNYASVIDEFMEGKVVMTTATTDVIRKLENARAEGIFTYEYGVATIPRLTDQMDTKGMSVTTAVYVNGYSQLKEDANRFARFITLDNVNELYDSTGKVTANKNIRHKIEHLNTFMDEYRDSAPIPKIMATSNLLIKMEIMFDRIWNGEDVSTQLMLLSEEIMSQVTGQPYKEEYIRIETEQKEYLEYVED